MLQGTTRIVWFILNSYCNAKFERLRLRSSRSSSGTYHGVLHTPVESVRSVLAPRSCAFYAPPFADYFLTWEIVLMAMPS
jgi:hypothetical protein